jgi:hypothetical protein
MAPFNLGGCCYGTSVISAALPVHEALFIIVRFTIAGINPG